MSYEAHKIRLIMELRKQGITDKRVLGAVERVPRELFVADAMRSEAYENIPSANPSLSPI
jgi:protein-L-isoaspartate(D-aspartate) O-methyltransferase